MAKSASAPRAPRQITGRMVLIAICLFFLVIFTVNFIMARFAITTFAGVETESSYKAGLQFSQEYAAAERQNDQHWTVDVEMINPGGTARKLDVTVLDAEGVPLTGLVALGRFAHPTDRRKDVELDMEPLGNGHYQVSTDAAPGQWVLVIDFMKGDERVFRSRNRIYLP
ncbi:FixH family protein [Xanthobacter sp. TB0136]|uniref:FixH family protein n=1 Tax=Xanthobacter sp. TB0136 TaxID=3459177 RepID=UPI0040399561